MSVFIAADLALVVRDSGRHPLKSKYILGDLSSLSLHPVVSRSLRASGRSAQFNYGSLFRHPRIIVVSPIPVSVRLVSTSVYHNRQVTLVVQALNSTVIFTNFSRLKGDQDYKVFLLPSVVPYHPEDNYKRISMVRERYASN
jgi:hypothetical protein